MQFTLIEREYTAKVSDIGTMIYLVLHGTFECSYFLGPAIKKKGVCARMIFLRTKQCIYTVYIYIYMATNNICTSGQNFMISNKMMKLKPYSRSKSTIRFF